MTGTPSVRLVEARRQHQVPALGCSPPQAARWTPSTPATPPSLRYALPACGRSSCGRCHVALRSLVDRRDQLGRTGTEVDSRLHHNTAPIDASSGDRNRHRLSPAWNRRINRALPIIAMVQLNRDPKGIPATGADSIVHIGVTGQRPVVPSISSRRTSACPACRTVSLVM